MLCAASTVFHIEVDMSGAVVALEMNNVNDKLEWRKGDLDSCQLLSH